MTKCLHAKQSMLPRNQIKHLFVWVHPDSRKTEKPVLAQWKALIETLGHERHTALVQTSIRGGPEKKPFSVHLQEYRQFIEQGGCSVHNMEYLDALEGIASLAASAMGNRYLFWTPSRFLLSDIREHFAVLSEAFGMKGSVGAPVFDAISCFGIEARVCVRTQAERLEYAKLAREVFNRGNFDFQESDWARYGIPSNPESRRIMTEAGMLP